MEKTSYGEYCVGEVGGIGNVVHAQVEVPGSPVSHVASRQHYRSTLQDKIFLIKRLAVKELVEIYDGVIRIIAVERVRASWLRVVLLHGVEIVGRPVGSLAESSRVLDGQMDHVPAIWRCVSELALLEVREVVVGLLGIIL